MTRRITRGAASVGALVALTLAAPAAAGAAGKVSSDGSGEVNYEGDAGPNVVIVTTTLTGPDTAKVVIAEPGVTEGFDATNICTAATDAVTCTVATEDLVSIEGEAGDDELTHDGPFASISLKGGTGGDRLVGGSGTDYIDGGDGDDEIDGREGRDQLTPGPGSDLTHGGDGGDAVFPDDEDGDRIDLGAGRDVILVNNFDGTADEVNGGGGVDTLHYQSASDPAGPTAFVRVDLSRGTIAWDAFGPYEATADTLSGIEDVIEFGGYSGDDVLIGDAGSNVLSGGNGSDTIDGGPGADTLSGDEGPFGSGLFVEKPGPDTINAFDGFADRVDCGGTGSVVADQFDVQLVSSCSDVEVRDADPYGIAPAPPPAPALPPSGGTDHGAPALDVRAPGCRQAKARTQKRRTFLRKGVALGVACDEPARVEVTASVAVKRASGRRLTLARAGDLVLDAVELDYTAGTPKVALTVPRALRGALGNRFTVRLRIDATDRAGNRSTQFASFKVR